jgi:molybdopterin molybdotransferase
LRWNHSIMLDWLEARQLIQQRCWSLASMDTRRDEALGRVMAGQIVSGVEIPAYDKSLVDGYAVQANEWLAGRREWEVVDEIMAGGMPQCALLPGQAAKIMTGAPLPEGADCVVMLEHTQPSPCGGSLRRIHVGSLAAGQHVMRRGAAMSPDRVVLERGQRLRSIELGILAELGVSQVQVVSAPRVSLLQTGDELADDGQTLGPGQIRNSNGPLLAAMVSEAGGLVERSGVVRDEMEALAGAVAEGLAADVLVLSGGVSMGDRDLVPERLEAAGVERVFHGVRLRPGKPLWFGCLEQPGHRTLVFGLPGNPVSGMVCFLLFVRPALLALGGRSDAWQMPIRRCQLTSSFSHRGGRATFWPGRCEMDAEQGETVEPLPWLGSADPFTLAQANVLVAFPPGDHEYPAGADVECWDLV